MNQSPEKLAKKLWGDHFYDKEKKKFVTEPPGGDYSTRGFNKFIMEPISKLMKAIKISDIDLVKKILKNLNITIKEEEFELAPRDLIRKIFKKWLNAADALVEMIVNNLPSPA